MKARIWLNASGKSFKRHKGVCCYVFWWEGGKEDGVRNALDYDATPAEAEAAMMERLLRGMHGRDVDIWTDCRQLVTTVEQWIPKWKATGWRNSKGEPVLELYRILSGEIERNNILFHMERHEYSRWMEWMVGRAEQRPALHIERREDGDHTDTDRETAQAPEERQEEL